MISEERERRDILQPEKRCGRGNKKKFSEKLGEQIKKTND